jgi:hypothetical protein
MNRPGVISAKLSSDIHLMRDSFTGCRESPPVQLQLLEFVLPVVEFAGQLVHAALPCAPLYVPAAHAVHGPPSSPVYPGAHLQSVLSHTKTVCSGHSKQEMLPTVFLYVFSTHASHGPPSGPV